MNTEPETPKGAHNHNEGVEPEITNHTADPEPENKHTAPNAAKASNKKETIDTKQQLHTLESKLGVQKEEFQKLYDMYVRSRADFENYRKRLKREKEEAVLYANKNLLLDVVGVLDNFKRAVQAAPDNHKNTDTLAFFSGVALIEKEWVAMLEKKWGLQRVAAVGCVFDPNMHEAVAIEEIEGLDSQKVVSEFQSGYLLHGRILRPAKVKVQVPKHESGAMPDTK